MKRYISALIALSAIAAFTALVGPMIHATFRPAQAQGFISGQRVVPLGYCQLATLTSSIGLSSCVRASFTGTGSGTNLTTTSVTGIIKVGDLLAGTGVPAGTTVLSQTSGTAGGAGVYVTSAATTSSGASLTAGGIPPDATQAMITVTGAIVRYRDDGAAAAPTLGIALPITTAGLPFLYTGTLSAIRFIETTTTAQINVAFYR